MLGRLLKYELKATTRVFLPLYLTIILFGLLSRFLLPIYRYNNLPTFFNIAIAIGIIIFVTLMIGLVLATLIVMVQRFYKNLLGDEGYLMFTLPVASHKHIFSKLIISMLWTFLSSLIAIFSICIISSQEISMLEIFRQLANVFAEFVQTFGAYSYIIGLEFIVLLCLGLASSIIAIYAAIALGHLFSKHKLLISFGMYILINAVTQVLLVLYSLMFINQSVLGFGNAFIPMASQVSRVLLIMIFFFGALTAGYFILTNYILNKKLNLE